MAKHIGTYSGIALQPRQRWSPRNGLLSEPRTKLLNSAVASYTAALRANGYAYEVEPIGESPHSIVTTLNVDEGSGPETILNDLWELDSNDAEKSIWELPKVRAELRKTGDIWERAQVRANIEALVRGDSEDGATAPANFDPEVYSGLLRSLISGVEAFAISTYVLRRVITLPALTTLAPGFSNSNLIYTTAQLLAFETSIPFNLGNTLPEGYWQKKPPSASQQSDGRWVYRVEYWWAKEYDPFIYETQT